MKPLVPPSSALSSLIASSEPHPSQSSPYHALTLQILHNLQHQHGWASLHIHTHSPVIHHALPRPLIAGLPPHRIYVHPDEQVEELRTGFTEQEAKLEMEWVLPTHLREKWNLRRFAEVFDAITEEPPGKEEENGKSSQDGGIEKAGRRKGGKRVLLAILGDDSTVVYYVVHDGIVKPRQN